MFLNATAGLAELRLRQGRLEDAEALLAGLEHEPEPALVLAEVKLARHQPAAAIQLLQRILRRLDRGTPTSIRAFAGEVEAHLALGQGEEASRSLAALKAATLERLWPEGKARASMAAGSAAQHTGDSDAAAQHFEDAIAAFSGLGMPYEAAVARLALAGASRDAQPDLAATEAASALDAFEQLGARPAADAASALLRTLGQASRPGPRAMGLLTLREQEVLALLRSGLSNPEIADRLVISRKTAAHHVSSLLAKLSVRNRAEAIALALRVPVDV